jgi:CHASE3 domain sensor protein
MADDQILRVLEEIRDLQKQHMENYQDALRNQREAIAIQKSAMRRVRWLVAMIGVVLLGIVPLLWSLVTPAARCIFRR